MATQQTDNRAKSNIFSTKQKSPSKIEENLKYEKAMKYAERFRYVTHSSILVLAIILIGSCCARYTVPWSLYIALSLIGVILSLIMTYYDKNEIKFAKAPYDKWVRRITYLNICLHTVCFLYLVSLRIWPKIEQLMGL